MTNVHHAFVWLNKMKTTEWILCVFVFNLLLYSYVFEYLHLFSSALHFMPENMFCFVLFYIRIETVCDVYFSPSTLVYSVHTLPKSAAYKKQHMLLFYYLSVTLARAHLVWPATMHRAVWNVSAMNEWMNECNKPTHVHRQNVYYVFTLPIAHHRTVQFKLIVIAFTLIMAPICDTKCISVMHTIWCIFHINCVHSNKYLWWQR